MGRSNGGEGGRTGRGRGQWECKGRKRRGRWQRVGGRKGSGRDSEGVAVMNGKGGGSCFTGDVRLFSSLLRLSSGTQVNGQK